MRQWKLAKWWYSRRNETHMRVIETCDLLDRKNSINQTFYSSSTSIQNKTEFAFKHLSSLIHVAEALTFTTKTRATIHNQTGPLEPHYITQPLPYHRPSLKHPLCTHLQYLHYTLIVIVINITLPLWSLLWGLFHDIYFCPMLHSIVFIFLVLVSTFICMIPLYSLLITLSLSGLLKSWLVQSQSTTLL